jgi:acetyltransferase-like isoleucine patch superfamily enzyme
MADRLLRQPRVWGDGGRLTLGHQVHQTNTLFNTVSGRIIVGDYVFFGHDVRVLTGTHDMAQRDLARQQAVPVAGRDIVIGQGVWIASGATILGPCDIGDHAVIAAGSVVTGVVTPGWIYAGSPAVPVRQCP